MITVCDNKIAKEDWADHYYWIKLGVFWAQQWQQLKHKQTLNEELAVILILSLLQGKLKSSLSSA